MYIQQISLTNQRIRNALKQYDSFTVAEAVLRLFDGDQPKADQLAIWFRQVANNCSNGIHLDEDVIMMRMWQLGNVDIKEIEENGKPVFVLTYTGSEIVKLLPEDQWFNSLLEDSKSSFV